MPAGSERFRDKFAFRAHPHAAEYATLKLAASFAHDRERYTDAKTDFIRGTVASATTRASS